MGEYSFENNALCTILFTLLNEPCFEQLRNKEQLGYVVQSGFSSQQKVVGGQILIQSSNHHPDYLESRINAFLNTMAEKDGPFSIEQIQAQIDSQILNLQMVA